MSDISRQLDIITNVTDLSPVYHVTDDGVYTINDVDNIINSIHEATQRAAKAELTEDDRKYVKQTKTLSKQFGKLIDRAVIDEKKRVFGEIDQQRKAVQAELNDFSAVLSQRMDEFDVQIREEKRLKRMSQFADEIAVRSAADDTFASLKITYADIENGSWYNRSMSESKAQAELGARLDAIMTLHKLISATPLDVTAVHMLSTNDWDMTAAVANVNEAVEELNEQKRREAEEEEKRRKDIEEAERRGREQAELERKEKAESAVNKLTENNVDDGTATIVAPELAFVVESDAVENVDELVDTLATMVKKHGKRYGLTAVHVID